MEGLVGGEWCPKSPPLRTLPGHTGVLFLRTPQIQTIKLGWGTGLDFFNTSDILPLLQHIRHRENRMETGKRKMRNKYAFHSIKGSGVPDLKKPI